MPRTNRKCQWRNNLLSCLSLLLLCGMGMDVACAQLVSQTRFFPADGSEFGTAISASGSSVVVGDEFWTNGSGGAVGAAHVLGLVNGQWTQQSELTASDGQTDDLFGASIATFGNMAVIGAPFHNGVGAVYLFTLSNGQWTQSQEILPGDGGVYDLFGSAIAMTQTALAIGAYNKGTGNGGVYIYALSHGKWRFQVELKPAPGSFGTFGYSLALSGTSLLVGAPGQKSGYGAAYIYIYNGKKWVQQSALAAADATTAGQFGYAVALSGNVAAIGSPGTSTAYVYQANSAGTGWALQTELNPFEGTSITRFGTAIAMTASTIVISSVNPDDREAYVFSLQQGNWTPFTELAPFGEAGANGGFGTAVAIIGSSVLVTRPYALHRSGTSVTSQGTVYSYLFGSEAQLPDGIPGDALGYSIVTVGTTVLAGAPGRNFGTGAVYPYNFSNGKLAGQAVLVAPSGQQGDGFGTALAFDGSTLFVGAPNAGNSQGVVYVYGLNSGKWTFKNKLVAGDGRPGDLFGNVLTLFNGVLVVGAPGKNNSTGAAYIFKLSAGKWIQQAELAASDGQPGDGFGTAVAFDGTNIYIGSPNATTGVAFNAGALYVFSRNAGQWALSSTLFALDGQDGDLFGSAVASSVIQLLVGAPGSRGAAGTVYPYVWSGSGLVAQAELTFDSYVPSGQFGTALATNGNMLLVGSYSSSTSPGAARLYVWSGGGWIGAPQWISAGDTQPGDGFGAAVAISGTSICIGAPHANFGTGSLYAF